jgi:hypothetical protein
MARKTNLDIKVTSAHETYMMINTSHRNISDYGTWRHMIMQL